MCMVEGARLRLGLCRMGDCMIGLSMLRRGGGVSCSEGGVGRGCCLLLAPFFYLRPFLPRGSLDGVLVVVFDTNIDCS
jgi:hypothetical protein